MGEKQWRQKTANTRKTPKIHEKGPKTVKIINIEIFAIVYFSRMEFNSSTRNIPSLQYWPVYGFFCVFLFFFGYFLFSDHTFWPKKLLFWNILWNFDFFTIFLWGGGVCGGGMAYDNLPPERSSSARCCACFSPFTFLFPHPFFCSSTSLTFL